MESVSILSSTSWAASKSFKELSKKVTQRDYYTQMQASPEVLQLVGLDSKPFGSVSEKIISEIFGLGPRTNSQNDATYNSKPIEIKAARYWAGKDDCKWQHLEPDHDYEYAILALLDFHGWKIWCIKKTTLMSLREKNIVTYQGKQGWWTSKSSILPYLKEIQTIEDLKAFVV
jgi:hypothetical protein